MITGTIQLEQIGVVCHALAKDGKSGNVAWISSPAHLSEGTRLFIMPPALISPQPTMPQPETNCPRIDGSKLSGHDQVTRDEFDQEAM